jgi:hypothetical protein
MLSGNYNKAREEILAEILEALKSSYAGDNNINYESDMYKGLRDILTIESAFMADVVLEGFSSKEASPHVTGKFNKSFISSILPLRFSETLVRVGCHPKIASKKVRFFKKLIPRFATKLQRKWKEEVSNDKKKRRPRKAN